VGYPTHLRLTPGLWRSLSGAHASDHVRLDRTPLASARRTGAVEALASLLARELVRDGHRTRVYASDTSRGFGGKDFSGGHLHRILRNRTSGNDVNSRYSKFVWLNRLAELPLADPLSARPSTADFSAGSRIPSTAETLWARHNRFQIVLASSNRVLTRAKTVAFRADMRPKSGSTRFRWCQPSRS
jgi:hypothetical protein